MADEPSLAGGGFTGGGWGGSGWGDSAPAMAVPVAAKIQGVAGATNEMRELVKAVREVVTEFKELGKIDVNHLVSVGHQIKGVYTTVRNAQKAAGGGGGTDNNGVIRIDPKTGSSAAGPTMAASSGGGGTPYGLIGGTRAGGGDGGGGGGGNGPSAASGPTTGGSGGDLGLGAALSGLVGGQGNIGSLVTALTKLGNVAVAYTHDRVEENRAATRGVADKIGAVGTLSGRTIENIIAELGAKTPVYGTVPAITEALQYGSKAGYSLASDNTTQARSGAFYETIRQQQMLAPGERADVLAQRNIQTLRDTPTQQRSMLLTGGAFSSFGAGGVPKTLQEWAESILRFFEGQRPGKQRGQKFSKEELQTQMFPGSNMNAWFQSVGVQQYMVDFFWQYAIGKANVTGSSSGAASMEDIAKVRGEDLAGSALMRETATSRREFDLAASGPGALGILGKLVNPSAWITGTQNSMYRQYVRREKSDLSFQGFMRGIDKTLANLMNGQMGAVIANMPTPIAEAMYNLEQNVLPGLAGTAANALAGVLGGGGGAGSMPVGDPGWGDYGGTSFIGMDPSFAARLQAMMDDNPDITITSGYRDGPTQERLHNAGVGQVAPPGQSFHSKGLAADLGPSDQFGWIAQNAHKYGLENAAHLGEPWHVGFPGTVPSGSFIGDVGGRARRRRTPVGDAGALKDTLFSGITDLMGGNFGSLFGKGGPFDDSQQESMGKGLSELFGIPDFKSLASGGTKGILGALAGFLLGGAGEGMGAKIGRKLTSGLGAAAGALGAVGAGVAGAAGAMGLASSAAGGVAGVSSDIVSRIFTQFNGGQRPTPAQVSQADVMRIGQTLQALKGAGFQGDSLIAMASIAGRESRWRPEAHNPVPPDDSYGLFQINMLGNLGPSRRKQFGIQNNAQLLDPNVAARAAWVVSGGGKNLQPWKMKGGNPLGNAAQYVEPVYNVAKQYGFVGDPRLGGRMQALDAAAGTKNEFNTYVTVGGGNMMDADAKRVGGVIADTLESQMKQRLSRTY